MELEKYRDQIIEWLSVGKFKSKIPKIEDCAYIDEKKGILWIILFTFINEYWIKVMPLSDNSVELSCSAWSRKHRTGENWCRGNHCTVGIFNKETWDKIIADIMKCELVQIQSPISTLFKFRTEFPTDEESREFSEE